MNRELEQKMMPAVGDLVHAKVPTHNIEWSKEHGFHIKARDAAGACIEHRRAAPAAGQMRVVAVHDDGTIDIEVPGFVHAEHERFGERAPAEIVRNVPHSDLAEWHVESADHRQRGPNWRLLDERPYVAGLFECQAAEWTRTGWRGTPVTIGRRVEVHADNTATIELDNGQRTRVPYLPSAERSGDQIGPHWRAGTDTDE